MVAAVGASLLVLTGCGGKGDDKLGEQAQKAMENGADAMDAAADNMTGTAPAGRARSWKRRPDQ
jgi:hypothetical protein